MSNDDTSISDLAAGGGLSNSEFDQTLTETLCLDGRDEINGIRIRRFRMYCAIKKNVRTESEFKYRANSVMVDKVGLEALAEQKRKRELLRNAKVKARDVYKGLKLFLEYIESEDPSEHSEQLKKKWERISKNMSDGVLTKQSLRDAFVKQYQDREQPSTEALSSPDGVCGYSLDFFLGI